VNSRRHSTIDPKVELAEENLAALMRRHDLAVKEAYQEHKRAVAALKDAKRDAEKGAEDE
jgi:hypothetical protein